MFECYTCYEPFETRKEVIAHIIKKHKAVLNDYIEHGLFGELN